VATTSDPPITFITLAAHWRAVFHAAGAALAAADGSFPAEELHRRTARLAAEVGSTENLLKAVAQDWHAAASFVHLMVSPSEARRALGLPATVTACVFDLDGVLTGSDVIHAAAWTETFDELISSRAERTGGRFPPFNPLADYARLIHGKPRLDGVRAFLASRGIRLPEGKPSDTPGAETVHGLANRKNQILLRRLDEHGVRAFEGSRSYLELAREAGVRCAVVSASANTETILERAGLDELIEQRVDGNTMRIEQLRAEPAPDALLAACRQLGVEPQHAAAFETTRAGVAAGLAAGFALVVGVDRVGRANVLRAHGAHIVVADLDELLSAYARSA
jgi:beta-phosphoglucomutase family hydrolase